MSAAFNDLSCTLFMAIEKGNFTGFRLLNWNGNWYHWYSGDRDANSFLNILFFDSTQWTTDQRQIDHVEQHFNVNTKTVMRTSYLLYPAKDIRFYFTPR